MRTSLTDGIAFGGDYNPEQWPRAVWRDDVRLMQESGVTFVTLGVFAWSWLEPAPGEYQFEWLDEVMGLLHEGGIAVDLATATATPPPWLSAAYPQVLPVDRAGHTLSPGSRQTWCPSSPVFRELALALTNQMAQRYHDHPALAMWHVSNEYACHNLPCFCDTCAVSFREWLQRRYHTLDALNTAWGTAFWSQRYTAWQEILPPRASTTIANPTHELDYHRFGSDTLLDFYLAEKATIRQWSAEVPITTNFMTGDHFRLLDYHQWAPHQDVISTDHYVLHHLEHPRAELSFQGDVVRGLAGGRPWILMENSTSAVNWQRVNHAKEHGETILDSIAHVARGADAVGFFQWRQSQVGAEKFHSALVPHAGPDSARFREVCELGRIVRDLAEVAGSQVEADVALLWDYQADWALSGPGMPSSELDYHACARTMHRLLRDRGITCDVIHPSSDLSRYRVIIVPTLYLVSDDDAAAVARAAAAGAHVVVTYFSGIADTDDHVRLGGYPGAFKDLLGIRVEEFNPLDVGQKVALSGGGSGTVWSEDAHAISAETVMTYSDGPFAGQVAVSRRGVERGTAWYLGTMPDDETLGLLLSRVTAEAGVAPSADMSPGLEVTRRSSETGSWLFVINRQTQTGHVRSGGIDLVSGRAVGPMVTVAPRSAVVIREA